MDAVLFSAELPAWVRTGWGRTVRSVLPTESGMNSATAVVDLEGERFVAKWVPSGQAGSLRTGSRIARRLARTGLATGEPLPTTRGQVTSATPDGALALLRFVPGTPLTATSASDQRRMAATLARVHAVDPSTRSEPFMADVVDLVHDVEPWVRPAVTAVVAELGRLPALTWGLLHGDPAPDAFLHDPATNQVGLIDWTAATRGPVLYDLASALMYLGGPDRAAAFWAGYREHSPLPADELVGHLPTFHRFRAAVQAAYFSARVAGSDLTGIADQQENWKGLRDAQRMLTTYGVLLDDHEVRPDRTTRAQAAPQESVEGPVSR